MRIGQPERLVIYEQLDDLAVGHVADRLAGPCEAISVFSVNDRARFIKSIDKSTILGIGPAFFRASTDAEIPVPKRKHRFELCQKFGIKCLFDDVPFVGRIVMGGRPEPFMMQHWPVSPTPARVGQSTNSPKSSITTCAP